MSTQHAYFFYQSAIVNFVKVDLNDPLHAQLFNLIENPETLALGSPYPHSIAQENIKTATKIMKKIPGFCQSWSLTNTPAWASDLCVRSMPIKNVYC